MSKKHPAPGLAEGIQHCLSLLGSSRLDAMEEAAGTLTRTFPSAAAAWQMLGVARLVQGNAAGALDVLERASELGPTDAGIWDNLGAALNATRAFDRAATCYARSLELEPRNAKVWSNAAANAGDAGRHAEALASASRALELDPALAHAHLVRGNALAALARTSEALAALRDAIRLAPSLVQAHLSLGDVLQRSGNTAGAIRATRRALEIAPNFADAHQNLGRFHHDLGQMAAAANHYRAALRLQPQRLAAWSGWLFCLAHDDQIGAAELFAAHREFGEFLERPWRERWGGWTNERDPLKRLRIGFVSGDLREHAVAHFIDPLWRAIDRSAFEIIAYATQPGEDARSATLRELVDGWHNVAALSDDAMAAAIREAQIDILIDLSGHTGGHRLGVFARKPAPIQVSWLGYPNTTGLTAIDYRLVNKHSVPTGMLDAFFTEKLVRLPGGYGFRSPDNAPPVNSLPALDCGHFTFASFNRPGKLSDAVIALWCRVLQAVPGSRMLIGAIPDETVRASLIERFAAHGIAADRLDLRPRMPMREYLELHHEVDAILDTFPYSGGTTTNHALWMGVPTLTLAGDTLPQRQGAGLLARFGLADWVVPTEAEFVARAVDIASNPQQLAELRSTLRGRIAGASAAPVAHPINAALRGMWLRWCAGQPAQAFEVAA